MAKPILVVNLREDCTDAQKEEVRKKIKEYTCDEYHVVPITVNPLNYNELFYILKGSDCEIFFTRAKARNESTRL
jgi:hypothetical protein